MGSGSSTENCAPNSHNDTSIPKGDMQLVRPAPGGNAEWEYLGGVVASNDLIYAIPYNATRAARFSPVSGTWQSFGDTFPRGNKKWWGAAVSSFDNCIYSAPSSFDSVSRVLKIDPIAGTAKEVGEDVEQLAIRMCGGLDEYGWGCMVAAPDGCLFAMPDMAGSVLRLDPRTCTLSTVGQWVPSCEDDQYWGGVLGPSGRFIYCVPANATRVLCIDTQTLTVQLIGDPFLGTKKWWGGGIGGDGCIYCIPFNARQILRIDPVTQTTSLFGPSLYNPGSSWSSGCAGIDGCVYGAPFKSGYVLKIDPLAGTATMMTDKAVPQQSMGKLQGAAVTRDGSIWFLPWHGRARMFRLDAPCPVAAPVQVKAEMVQVKADMVQVKADMVQVKAETVPVEAPTPVGAETTALPVAKLYEASPPEAGAPAQVAGPSSSGGENNASNCPTAMAVQL